MKHDSETRPSLLRKAEDGDQQAWEEIVEIYGPSIRRQLQNKELNAAAVDDATQEVFLKVHTYLISFERIRKGSFRKWISVIAGQAIADHFRKNSRSVSGFGGSDWQMELNAQPSFSDDAVVFHDVELAQQIEKIVLAQYPERNRRAYELSLYGDASGNKLSDSEIGKIVGLSRQGVWANYKRIIEKIEQYAVEFMAQDHL